MWMYTKVVTRSVANHFHLLRFEGAPQTQGFLFKMEPVLPNHIGLSGTEASLDFVAKIVKVPGNRG